MEVYKIKYFEYLICLKGLNVLGSLNVLRCLKEQRKTSEMFCIRKHFRGIPINLRSQIIFKNLRIIIN